MFKKFNLFVIFFLFTFANGQFISELPVTNTLGKHSNEQINILTQEFYQTVLL